MNTVNSVKKIIKIGDSRGITLSPSDLSYLNADIGDELVIHATKNSKYDPEEALRQNAEELVWIYNKETDQMEQRKRSEFY